VDDHIAAAGKLGECPRIGKTRTRTQDNLTGRIERKVPREVAGNETARPSDANSLLFHGITYTGR
jgi:hypothetical protein